MLRDDWPVGARDEGDARLPLPARRHARVEAAGRGRAARGRARRRRPLQPLRRWSTRRAPACARRARASVLAALRSPRRAARRAGAEAPAAAGRRSRSPTGRRSAGLRSQRFARLGDADALAALRGARPICCCSPARTSSPPRCSRSRASARSTRTTGCCRAYRGMNVTEWSVLHGDPPGVTVHIVDPGIDTGDILLREEIPLPPGATLRDAARAASAGGRARCWSPRPCSCATAPSSARRSAPTRAASTTGCIPRCARASSARSSSGRRRRLGAARGRARGRALRRPGSLERTTDARVRQPAQRRRGVDEPERDVRVAPAQVVHARAAPAVAPVTAWPSSQPAPSVRSRDALEQLARRRGRRARAAPASSGRCRPSARPRGTACPPTGCARPAASKKRAVVRGAARDRLVDRAGSTSRRRSRHGRT